MAGGWQDYITTLMADGNCRDAAIVGYKDTPSLWAALPGGNLSKITPEQIKELVKSDRGSFHTSGPMLGDQKYMLTRDALFEDERRLVLSCKAECAKNCIAVVARTKSALIIVEGKAPDIKAPRLISTMLPSVQCLADF